MIECITNNDWLQKSEESHTQVKEDAMVKVIYDGKHVINRGQAWAGNCGRPPGYRYSNPHSPTENLIA